LYILTEKQNILMKRTSFIATAFIFILFVACKSEADKSSETTVPALNPEAQSVPAANNPFITPGNDTLSKGSGNLALNPQHGQPGHRCDIAVGAPLNSPASNANVPASTGNTNTIQQSGITTTIPPANNPPPIIAPNTNPTGAKLNPQHGQPGHRCDIAVGAPLDSKPKQ
jgi:hypothetical protein